MPLKNTLRAAVDTLPKRHLARLIRRFYTPPRRVQNWLRVEGAHRVEVDDQASFQVADDSRLFWNGLYGGHDEHLLRLWVRLCRSARVIFDVGAFRGVLALTAAAANPQAQVFAFEPVGLHYQLIMRNIALNPHLKLECVRAAVGDSDQMTQFYSEGTSARASLNAAGGRPSEEVPLIRLDTFIRERQLPPVDLIKIDVETYEPQVLRGLGECLAEMRPTLIVEVLSEAVGDALAEIVNPLGYEFYLIDEHQGAVRQPLIRRKSKYSRDYLLCLPDVAQSLGLR